MAYSTALLIHSSVRWIILAILLTALIKSLAGWMKKLPFSGVDRVLQIALTSWVDMEVLVGLFLYWMSPLTPKSGEQMSAAMKVPSLRFFAVEHQVLMILALIALHVGSVLSRRAEIPPHKHRRWFAGLALTLVLMVLGIPWSRAVPGMKGDPMSHSTLSSR